ncbi:organic cation transporter protein-like [Anticarsia gemmatalis]|uniref:organic cation transporter protein-like n=1 Tax=Anticarsia gemmatalis TaxID=129554 RepID=UPI003F75D2D0
MFPGATAATVSTENTDLIEKSIGGFKLYHLWICFLVFLSKFPIAWHQMAIIFLSPHPIYTCDDVRDKCPCSHPVYDKSIFTRTIVMEWNLICDRKWLRGITQMLFQFGTLTGSILLGMASDRYGRRPTFIASIILQITAGITSAYMISFWAFSFFRFFVGVSVGGSMVVGFVVVMEFVGTKYRPMLAAIYQIPFNVGHLILPAFAYFLRDYSDFQLAISIPGIILLSYIYLLPETPRWLVAMGRTEEAIKLAERIAKINKLSTDTVRVNITSYQTSLGKQNLKRGTLWDIFKNPNLRRNILAMAYTWFACSYCFYGISQYIGEISGNIFVNVSINAALTLSGSILCIPLVGAMRRRSILIMFACVCAVCLLILAFTPESFVSVIFASIGDIAAFNTFIVVYLHCSELFPTVVRNAAIGFSSMIARVGSMIAPFVVELKYEAKWLPPVLFALAPTIAIFVTLILPETKGCEMMTTIEEAENFGKRHRNIK